eukprot:8836661-Pyramimonas_sp.AAC.1
MCGVADVRTQGICQGSQCAHAGQQMCTRGAYAWQPTWFYLGKASAMSKGFSRPEFCIILSRRMLQNSGLLNALDMAEAFPKDP